jgi:purine-binding chemotaxis protein CheW
LTVSKSVFRYSTHLNNNLPLHRALEKAPERPSVGQSRPEQEFFCFSLGNVELGVASENVREVIRTGSLTPLPRTPAFILGVSGHRGVVLPVLDLLRFMGKGEAKLTQRTRLFVAVSDGIEAALVTDVVIGLRVIPLTEIVPAPLGGDAASEHLLGVVNPRQAGDTGLTLLNLPKVLQAARQRARAK